MLIAISDPATEPERRTNYRLHFPRAERPLLVINGHHYEVVDCSVRGLRCMVNDWQPRLALGDQIDGLVRFRDRAQAPVRGLVVRIQEGEIALYLPDTEIPFTVLRGEERYLLAHYRARTG